MKNDSSRDLKSRIVWYNNMGAMPKRSPIYTIFNRVSL